MKWPNFSRATAVTPCSQQPSDPSSQVSERQGGWFPLAFPPRAARAADEALTPWV